MPDPILLKLNPNGDRIEIEIRILHPMNPDNVLPQEKGGHRSPLFLQTMVIQLNENNLVEGQLSTSLSKNPKFGFSFSSVRTGDKFTVICTDNQGTEFKREIFVTG